MTAIGARPWRTKVSNSLEAVGHRAVAVEDPDLGFRPHERRADGEAAAHAQGAEDARDRARRADRAGAGCTTPWPRSRRRPRRAPLRPPELRSTRRQQRRAGLTRSPDGRALAVDLLLARVSRARSVARHASSRRAAPRLGQPRRNSPGDPQHTATSGRRFLRRSRALRFTATSSARAIDVPAVAQAEVEREAGHEHQVRLLQRLARARGGTAADALRPSRPRAMPDR